MVDLLGKRVYYKNGKMWNVGRLMRVDRGTGKCLIECSDGQTEVWREASEVQSLSNVTAVADVVPMGQQYSPPPKKKPDNSFLVVVNALRSNGMDYRRRLN